MFEKLFSLVTVYLSNASRVAVIPVNYIALARTVAVQMGRIVVPMMLVLVTAALLIGAAQVGVMVTFEPLTPKFSKLNPIAGFSKFLSARQMFELPKSILKLTILGSIGYYTLRGRLDEIIPLMLQEPSAIFSTVGSLFMLLGTRVAIAMILLSIVDFGFQKFQYERENRMTKQEVRDELRQYEGDPLIKSRIKVIQRQMAMQRMMAAVPEAEVVITNPVELAVALRYDGARMNAPQVVAKGQRLIAARIRALAIENSVPIVENPTLARALVNNAEVGDEIPEMVYQAVAEVLAYVYQIDQRAEKIQERRELSLAHA
jgi:flagellar biosynthetic protein FlhB